MSVYYELHRPRQVARVFKSPEKLVAEVLGEPSGNGHADPRPRLVQELKALAEDTWLTIDGKFVARRFEAFASDIESPIE